MDLYVIFFIAALVLLIVEVIAGMTLGVFLSAAVTFFILGLIDATGLLKSLNAYLFTGATVFVVATFLTVKFLRGKLKSTVQSNDVNDY